jgi:catechol 2,3-dioxygenase-like lactoylglutathione lyase family enzyme
LQEILIFEPIEMNLNQVTVPSLDVERSIKFYQLLGLKLIVHTHPRYARFELSEGNSSFSIQQVDELRSGNGIHVYFEVPDLVSTYNTLKDKGVVFESTPTKQKWLWHEARLKDPDGNFIILYHAGKNRLNPPWRLSV